MATPVVYADYLRRQYSALIDGPIIVFLGLVADYLFTFLNIQTGLPLLPYIIFRIFVVMQIPGLFYILICWGRGQTLGMKVANIRLVDAQMRPIGFGRAVLRYVLQLATGVVGFFNYMRMMSDVKKQALYDRIAGTYIIHASEKKPSQVALFCAYALNGALMVGMFFLITTSTKPPIYSIDEMARVPLWALVSNNDPFEIKPAARANYNAGQAFLLQAQRLDVNEQKYLEKLYLIAQSARGEFKQALTHDPDNPRIYAALGLAYNYLPSDAAKQGQYEAYTKAVELDPNNPENVYGLGISAMRLEYHDEAISLLQKAIGMKEEYATAHNSLGALYESIGQVEDARFHYQKALEYYQKDNKNGKNDGIIQALQTILSKL